MQATAYNPGTTGGRREDLRNVLTILEPEETPFTSSLRKGPAPKSTFIETLGDTLKSPNLAGTKPGTDAKKGGNKAKNRARFGVYVHRAFDEFGVDDVQQIISERGGQAGVDNEYGNAKAKCLRELKRSIEGVNLGSQDHSGGDDDTNMTTRGAFSWLSGTAQATNPVPASFRTPVLPNPTISGATHVFGNNIVHGATAVPLFTEDELIGALKNLTRIYGGKRTYQLIGGVNVTDTVDHFLGVTATGSTTVRRVNYDGVDQELSVMCKVYDCSFGRVEVQTDLFCNMSSTDTIGSDNSGVILNMDLWHMDLFDALHTMDLPDLGGGPNGYAKAMWALLCDSPRGNGKLYTS